MCFYHSGGLQSILPPSHIDLPKISISLVKIVRKKQADEFSIQYDNEVMHHHQALVVGSISTTEFDRNPLDSELDKFKN
jgi:hypothetical protein